MTADFDPHYIWLGIPPNEQPADHYRLLGLDRRESNPTAIDNAFESRQAQLTLQLEGEYEESAKLLLAELNDAHRILSDTDLKQRYDAQFPPVEPEPPVARVNPGRVATRPQSNVSGWLVAAAIVVVAVVGLVIWGGLGRAKTDAGGDPKRIAEKTQPRSTNPTGKKTKKTIVAVPPKRNTLPQENTQIEVPSSPAKKNAKVVPAGSDNQKTKKVIANKKNSVGRVPAPLPTGKKKTAAPRTVRPPLQRAAVPPAGLQTRARKTVRRTFAEKYRQATTAASRREFAQFMFQQAVTLNDDRTAQYVLFDEAIRIAVQAHSVQMVEKFAPQICLTFKVEPYAFLASAFKMLAKEPLSVSDRALLTQSSLDAANSALLVERMKEALELVRIAVSQSARVRDMGLRKQALKLRATVRTRHRQWAEVKEARATLKLQPKNALAHDVVGRYDCLRKGRWKSGLKHLAQSKSDTLRKLAGDDRANPSQPADQKQLALRWLRYSKANKRNQRFGVRAQHWFVRALPHLRGLDRKMVEFELSKLDAAFPRARQTTTPRNISTRFLRSLVGHRYWVSSMVFSNDSRFVYSGGYDNEVRRWDVDLGKSAVLGLKQTKQVTSVVLSKTNVLAIAGYDKKIHLWDAAASIYRGSLVGHMKEITSLAISPDGNWLASSSADERIHIWDLRQRKHHSFLSGHRGGVTSLAFASDSRSLVSGGRDNTVVIWDAKTGRAQTRLAGHGGPITCVAVAGPERVVSASLDRQVIIWDVKLKAARMTLSSGRHPARAVALSNDGMLLAFGGQEKQVQLYDATSGKSAATLSGHRETITTIAFSPDRKLIGAGSQDYSLRLWAIDRAAVAVTKPAITQVKPKPRPVIKQQPKPPVVTPPQVVDKGKKKRPVAIPNPKKLVIPPSAIAQIRNLGGRVSMTRNGLFVDLSRAKVNDESLKVLATLPPNAVTSLNLTRSKITGAGLVHVQKLSGLKTLRLDYTPITDAHLVHLARLVQLETLRLFQTQVKGPGLKHLRGMKHLRNLTLPYDLQATSLAELSILQNLAYVQLPKDIDDTAMQYVGQLSALRSLHLTGTRVSDAGVGFIVGMANLQMLTLPARATNRSATAIAQLKNLRTLNLGNTQINDQGFMSIKHLGKLTSLQLPRGVTNSGLARLKECVSLKYLQIWSSQMQAGAVKHISPQAGITSLIVNGNQPFDDQVARFAAALPNLTTLQVNGSGIGDAGMRHLSGLARLRTLSLHSKRVTNAGLSTISKLPQLRQLSLMYAQIDDAGLQRLQMAPQLSMLNIQRTKVTAAGIARFRQALPRCRVLATK